MSITISATELGSYASDLYCPRCAWVRRNVRPLPYQIFPGIFSSIDRYNKLIVHGYFDRTNTLPSWLQELGDVRSYIEPPHWRKFAALDEDTGITLRGEADGIFQMADGSYAIVDYKTSKYTPGQQGLQKQYWAQLNAYAYIGHRLDLAPVSKLALIYMEPVTDEDTARQPQMVDSSGFTMGLAGTVVPIDLVPDALIPMLLREALRISRMADPPSGLEGCKDCSAVEGLRRAMGDGGEGLGFRD